MTAMILGAAYTGGIYFFARVVAARRWHTIQVGFLPVAAFAALLGIATILHWDRFTHNHISFIAWAGLYFAAPFLVLAVWLRNRWTDPRLLDQDDHAIPSTLRWMVGVTGAIEVAIGLLMFLQPNLMVAIWPWKLTLLTARVIGALIVLPGLGDLGIAMDQRWSAARISLEAQAFSLLLILISAARAWSDFNPSSLSTWFFIGGLSALLVGIIGLYTGMEVKSRR